MVDCSDVDRTLESISLLAKWHLFTVSAYLLLVLMVLNVPAHRD